MLFTGGRVAALKGSSVVGWVAISVARRRWIAGLIG